MAGVAPFFLSGGNARILMDGQTVGFATNVSYRVVVKHYSPRVLGRYEVEDIYPLSYDIFGSLTMFRYASKLQDKIKTLTTGVSSKGNSIASFTNPVGKVNEAINPGKLLASRLFDIEIRQKFSDSTEEMIFKLRDCRIDEIAFDLNKRGLTSQTLRFTARYLDDDVFTAQQSGEGQEKT